MQDFEKLGVFYLGKEYDPAAGAVKDDLILLDAKDLTTHAMIVGMTGSGKTGLALALLEEAALDGIPSILIDPKGDLCNILLRFPGLSPAEFRPWVDEAEAARAGLSADELAAKTAETWKNGLAQWGQGADRVQRLKDAVDMAVYTPGNSSGRPLQVLRSFAAPPPAVAADTSALRDRIMTAVSGLLGLLGIEADPVQSPEHILLSTILDRAWREGRSLDLAGIIKEIQKPPFEQIGVFDLETFYPAKDRFKLAISLNNLLAAPGFSAWLEGEPLDPQRLLFTPQGKPRVSVLSIAHLSDQERMFFVTALLNEMLSWMRAQSGTSSLRALLYMDEIFGYFPPTANPPSKLPMLTLLKQARAFGLGVVLSTQNPVDLDYKGLANCGAWFIGRLQTERDKMRVIEGLESALAGSGGGFDRAQVEKELSNLSNRVFLLRNVHDQDWVLFQTRWTMSYLRGPLTLPQIKALCAVPGPPVPAPAPALVAPAPVAPPPAPVIAKGASDVSRDSSPPPAAPPSARPILPPDTPEYFLRSKTASGAIVYRPFVFGATALHFVDAKTKVDLWVNRTLIAPLSADGREALWEEAETRAGDLKNEADIRPAASASFDSLPPAASNTKTAVDWKKSFATSLYQGQTLSLWEYPDLKLTSKPEESEGDFRTRIGQALREKRDLALAKLKADYAPRLQALDDQLRRALQLVEKEKEQAGQQKLTTAVSIGATVLGAFVGRGRGGASTLNRAATAAKSLGRIGMEQADMERANESVVVLSDRKDALDAQFKMEAAELQIGVDSTQVELTTTELRPRKSDLVITAVGVCWVPG
jgi:hypothetical protein